MSFTVARGTFHDRIMIRYAWLLGCFRNAIHIGTQCNHRLSATPCCSPRCGDTGYSFLDLEAIFLKKNCEVIKCFVFLKAKFRKTEQHVVDLLPQDSVLLNFACCISLEFFNLLDFGLRKGHCGKYQNGG